MNVKVGDLATGWLHPVARATVTKQKNHVKSLFEVKCSNGIRFVTVARATAWFAKVGAQNRKHLSTPTYLLQNDIISTFYLKLGNFPV